MSEFVIEKATLADLAAVYRLSLLLNSDDDTKSRDDILKGVNNALARALIWIAKKEGQVIGYIMCELFEEDERNFPNSVFISELYVLDQFRKKGAAGSLIKAVLADNFPEEYSYFSVTHDPHKVYLTDLYKSFGFKKQGATDVGNVKLIKQRAS